MRDGAPQLEVRRPARGLDEAVAAPERDGRGQLLAGDDRHLGAVGDRQRLGDQRAGDAVALGGRARRRSAAARRCAASGARSSAPTGRPSRVASSPPPASSAAAMVAGVSPSASAGGSRAGRAANAARTTACTASAASAPTRRTTSVIAGRPGRPAAASSWSSSALTWSWRSSITMWPAPSHSSSVEPRSARAACGCGRSGVILSSVPQMIAVGTCSSRARSRTCRACRTSGRSRRPPRTASPRACRRRTRRTARVRRRRRRTRRWRRAPRECPSLRNRSTVRWPRASAATSRQAIWPPTVEGSSGTTSGAGRGRRRWCAIRPTPTTRSPNSSGCCSASATIVIPPIEWPTSTTGPSGTASSSTRSRSWPSCSMVAWSSVDRPDRPCERWS